jgi:DNA-binding phage protein
MHDLLDIKARLDAASPGPWRALTGAKQRAHDNAQTSGFPVPSNAAFPMTLSNNEYVLGEFSAWMSDGDRALIVNARRDIERLLNEVQYLQGHLAAVLAGDGDDQLCIDARNYLARARMTP